MERRIVERDDLTGIVRAAMGKQRRLLGVTRITGGTKKGVYRAVLGDSSTAIIYIWDPAENYWPVAQPEDTENLADPFSSASGIELFEAAHRRLDGLGIRTPKIYLSDRSMRHFPASIAVIEDVSGGSLETLLQDNAPAAAATLAGLAEALDAMHGHTGPAFGKVALLDNGGISVGRTCEQIVLDRALTDLAEAAARDGRIGDVHERLETVVRRLAADILPRSVFGLIHGELGPDHVLIDQRGQPVLIDIEGLMYFDVEWEHVFLKLRFGRHYQSLHRSDLDEQRLAFYALAMRLSLVAGPLRLLDGDFPNRSIMIEIVEANLAQALAVLP